MNYRIKSGEFTVNKRFFGREVLKSGSFLRVLLGMEGKWSKKITGIEKRKDVVIVTYQRDDTVYLDDDFKRFIKKMQEEYQDQIHGWITVSKIRGMMDFLDFTVEF